MKKLLLTLSVFGALTVNASAYTYSTPNVFGGYNYYGSNGSYGYTTPNVFGGSNFYRVR